MPIKIYTIQENHSPFGADPTILVCYKNKPDALAFIQKQDNAYLSIKEAWAIQVGNNFYLLAKESPIFVVG